MSVTVRVDLDSAVVSYRPAAGEERSSLARQVSSEVLLRAAPWRRFRWYFGQRHYSGTYWSSTRGDHVIYESRLELADLLLADFDSQVRQIVAQPFMFRAEVQGQVRKHIVDYLWGTDDGPVVVDVVRAERMSHPGIALLCAWTRLIVESLGWSYLVVNEPVPVQFGNVRFLAGYRREWLIDQEILADICSRPDRFAGVSIAEAETSRLRAPETACATGASASGVVSPSTASLWMSRCARRRYWRYRNEACRCESGNGNSLSLRRQGHRNCQNSLRSRGSGGGGAPC